jgi:hypothetical protein
MDVKGRWVACNLLEFSDLAMNTPSLRLSDHLCSALRLLSEATAAPIFRI